MGLIEKIAGEPGQLKKFSLKELDILCGEIRQVILETVSRNGGHLSSNLGIVELTVSLHRTFNIPPDKVIWDVGHQCYAHKLLTGRHERFSSLRKYRGISGYPAPEENETDIFKTGHAGTAVSSACGLKTGQDFSGDRNRVIAVIGDGSLTNGLTFEGLNFLGGVKKKMLVILNDNKMSISSTKGALSYYLTRLITSPFLNKPRKEFVDILKKIHSPFADDILRFAEDVEKKARYLLVPGVFFEKIGLRYFGPIDGHDMKQLLEILVNIKDINEPVLLHVITKKGKGYGFAEKRPDDFHGTGPFDIETGQALKKEGSVSPGKFAGTVLEKIAERNEKLVVLTAAMEKGLGLERFADRFPGRFFDVGIAEGHCITFAAGLARAGMKVVVAIYSTFLQRGYDQVFHDVCLQNLPVVFIVDRAGIAGEDGATHQGTFDISFLRTLPLLKIFTPCSLRNLEDALSKSMGEEVPCFIRYPKDHLPEDIQPFVSPGSKAAVLACGSMAEYAVEACRILAVENIPVSCFPVNAVKPVDEQAMGRIKSFDKIVTVEENSISGGFGSSILEYFNGRKEVFRIGLPEVFLEHGEREILLEKYEISSGKIAERIKEFLK